MTQTDRCPISDNGNHRYFIFKVVEVFEPVDPIVLTPSNDMSNNLTLHGLYQKVEYAVSGCNCGLAIKQRVKEA